MSVIDERLHVVVDEMPMPRQDQPPQQMYRATFRTVTLTAGMQTSPIVDGPDNARVSCTIIALDAPVVLGDHNQAKDGANIVTGIPNPVGAIIPINVPMPIPAQNEISIACPLAGNAINRVSVITVHKVQQ
jgi:hypothetical protein